MSLGMAEPSNLAGSKGSENSPSIEQEKEPSHETHISFTAY